MTDVSAMGEGALNIKWGALVLLGLLAVIFGLLIAFFPHISMDLIVVLIGLFIILLSFGAILLAAVTPGGWKESILLVVLAIIGFFFGIATLLSPTVMGKVIMYLLGIALFIVGLIDIILAIAEKNMVHRGLTALKGIVSLIVGIAIIAAPIIGASLVVILIAVYFVFWGIISIILGYSIRAAGKMA